MEQNNAFLGTAPIGKLMRGYALPCIISLLVGALYNIVDQIFIANASYLGSYGNAANTVVFPLTVVALAIAVMVGDGCCAFVSISLGRQEGKKASRSVGNAVLLCVAASLILTAVYLIFADQIIAMSLRGVTVQLPQYGIERLFIPERYVQRNIEQGSCAISLYPGWQYSYVQVGNEKTRKSISGAELAQSLGGVVQVGTSESSLARRVANVERRAGIANAQELGKLLGSMADNGLHSASDFDKQISAYQREEMKLRNEIAELRSKSKIYAASAHNLQACRTYKSVWLEYASKPLAQKDTFYKQNEAALQAYSRAASQLDKMGISLGTEPEKVRQLVTETESRIADLIAELEIVRKINRAIQEDKEKVEQIQSG